MTDYRSFAIQLAKKSGAIIRSNFKIGVSKKWKNDGTPVTRTDLEINKLVLLAIRKKFPAHSIVSEEGSALTNSEYAWVCDPIDGTVPFSHGYPTFAFSLALTQNGRSILGVAYDPILDHLVVAEKGRGAFLNGKRIAVRKESKIGSKTFVNIDGDHTNRILKLRELLLKRRSHVSILYSCVYASIRVASGEFSAEVYEWNKSWDAASVKIIAEEAGGRVTDLRGREQRYDRPIHGFIAGTPAVHRQLVRMIAPLLLK